MTGALHLEVIGALLSNDLAGAVQRSAQHEEKNRAIVLVIDKSGSMREDNRILYAQEAAKAVARQLKDNDLLGVVGFDVDPFVVVPLASVGSIKGSFNSQIDRLKPGGPIRNVAGHHRSQTTTGKTNCPAINMSLFSATAKPAAAAATLSIWLRSSGRNRTLPCRPSPSARKQTYRC